MIPKDHFTFDKYELLNDDNINVIVELIDDADAAFEIVSYALKHGKAVVTANKKEIVSFTLIRSAAGPAWSVLGSLTSYG